jgi:uncharacterized protein (TIGR02452 family)
MERIPGIIQELQNLRENDPEGYRGYMTSVYYPYSQDCPVESYSGVGEYKTNIYVTERDCLEASSVMAILERDPLVLNMANAYNCGGGFDGPRGSQEEYLIRNTSLIASLWPHRRSDDVRWPEGNILFPDTAGEAAVYYPLTNCGVIYSPSVRVLNFSHHCAVISLAQQDLRTNRPYSSGAPFDYGLTLQNFRSLFSVAASHGHRTLILGAIGCGAFRNPPERICEAFAELLVAGGEFENVFETIVFAIIKSAANLTAFENAFGEKVELESIFFPEEERDGEEGQVEEEEGR